MTSCRSGRVTRLLLDNLRQFCSILMALDIICYLSLSLDQIDDQLDCVESCIVLVFTE